MSSSRGAAHYRMALGTGEPALHSLDVLEDLDYQ
jgi:hypothetical protein